MESQKYILQVEDIGGIISLFKSADSCLLVSFNQDESEKIHSILPLVSSGKYPCRFNVGLEKHDDVFSIIFIEGARSYRLNIIDNIVTSASVVWNS